jgi:hypothetical protein
VRRCRGYRLDVISLGLARRLRDSGLRWDPALGDRFVVADREMDDEIFTLSDMTVELHDLASGPLIRFNGTVEWALDSVEPANAVWLPSETQLRERLGTAFRLLARDSGGWRIEVQAGERRTQIQHADAEEAYGLALLHLITGE